jgi:hypothetical protein
MRECFKGEGEMDLGYTNWLAILRCSSYLFQLFHYGMFMESRFVRWPSPEDDHRFSIEIGLYPLLMTNIQYIILVVWSEGLKPPTSNESPVDLSVSQHLRPLEIWVSIFARCHLIWLRGQSSCWWWQQTKSKISSWLFTFYIRCHLIWLRGHSTCWWWQQTKSKISSWLFTFLSVAIWFDLGWLSCFWWWQHR